MIKYLHEVAHADFTMKNRREESALQLAIIYNKDIQVSKLKRLVQYLVEEVDVNVAYNYEETLLV